MNQTDQEKYDELSLYTLELRDPEFIHQYIVDAYAAQYANEKTKPITVAFALAGLYLHLERGYTGKEVQLAHMQMAKTKKEWPVFELPKERGSITVNDALSAKPGEERNKTIVLWSKSVWEAWTGSRERVISMVKGELGL